MFTKIKKSDCTNYGGSLHNQIYRTSFYKTVQEEINTNLNDVESVLCIDIPEEITKNYTTDLPYKLLRDALRRDYPNLNIVYHQVPFGPYKRCVGVNR